MKITIIGMGNGGCALAADLASKGHRVTMLKSSGNTSDPNFRYLRENHGRLLLCDSGRQIETNVELITAVWEEAIPQAELIVIFVQTNYHEAIIKRLIPLLSPGQVVLSEPGYLSTALFLKHGMSNSTTLVEAESSPIDCRIVNPGHINVLFRNVRNPLGVFPRARQETVLNMLKPLDLNFCGGVSVLEAALHNPNLIVHTVGAILSIPRIEYSKGIYSMYREVFTPSVWRIVKALDSEKMDVMRALKLPPLPYLEACKYRNSMEQDSDAEQVFFNYAQNFAPAGPSVPDSRYVTEDVPQGLVMLESLGRFLNVSTPICSSLIDLASSALDIEFRSQGRSLEVLGAENLNSIITDLSCVP